MFDKYLVGRGGAHHHHTHTITEQRAPTDESVRLLKEMEEQAREKVLGTIRLENCPIDGVVFQWRYNFMDDQREFFLRAKLGGKPLEVRYMHNDADGGHEAIMDGLMKAVSDAVVRQILQRAFEGVAASKFGGPFK